MAAPEPEDEKSWQELLRKMLPSGVPLPDDDHLDYSIAVEYEGPPLPYEVPKVDPVDIDSLHTAASGASGSGSELSSIPVAEPVDRDASRFSRIRNGDAANETQTSTSFSVGFSSEFSAQDSNSEPKPVEDDAGGGGNRAAVVTFNTPRESETEDDGDRSSSPQSEPVGSPVAWASPLKVASKRGICSRCGKGNRLKEREWCLVCDSKYCSNCLLKAMGSMPEGRKCVSCIGQPIDESKRPSLGKCSKLLSRVCSPLEIGQIMRAEKECPANQLRPQQLVVNGRELREEELGEILGCEVPPQKLKPGRYWYDKDSGLWGKEGEKPDCIITPKLNVGGKLRADASNGNTNVFMNGREITKIELRVLKVEDELSKLEQLKSIKLKEILLKKKLELEEVCRQSHMVTEILSAAEYSNEAIESGAVDPACLLEQIELQIARAKEEALSRKEILEKIEKWLAACQEESWLEEYNRDDNRYTAGRGAHITLKRAKKVRVLVNKIPGMVETLTSKATAWEKERGLEFLYDGVKGFQSSKSY